MTGRQINAYTAPRRSRMRVENVLVFLVLAGVKAWHLNKGRPADAAYALAQSRGVRLARQMRADGSLKAKSPRKEVRIP